MHRAAARARQRQPAARSRSTSTAPAATSPTGSRSTTRSRTSSRPGSRVTIVVQGMAYSMGSVVLQAASPGRRWAFPHSWIMIHEPAKWAGWQSTTAAAQHLDRLKQMQDQIYRILAVRSGKPLRQIIRDTKRTDFYLDAAHAKTLRPDRRSAGTRPAVFNASWRESSPRSTRSNRRAWIRCRQPTRRRTGHRRRRAAEEPDGES